MLINLAASPPDLSLHPIANRQPNSPRMLNTDREIQFILHRPKQLGQIMDKIPLIIG
jgi:hypothetical protein